MVRQDHDFRLACLPTVRSMRRNKRWPRTLSMVPRGKIRPVHPLGPLFGPCRAMGAENHIPRMDPIADGYAEFRLREVGGRVQSKRIRCSFFAPWLSPTEFHAYRGTAFHNVVETDPFFWFISVFALFTCAAVRSEPVSHTLGTPNDDYEVI